MRPSADPSEPRAQRGTSVLAVAGAVCLAAAAVLLVGHRLGERALHDFDEPLTGARALAMLTSGEPLTVHFNGSPDYRKPPLNYWLIAAAYRIGGVSELTTRLPVAIAALYLLVALYRLGRWLVDPAAGALAVVALLGTGVFLVRARYATADMLLYGATLDAMLAFAEARYVRAGIGVGIAILAKGLAGGLAPVVVVLWMALTRDLTPLKRGSLWLGVAIAVALVTPWVAWNALNHRDEFVRVFWTNETANRLVRKMSWSAVLAFYGRKAADQLDLLPAAALLAPLAAWLDPGARMPRARGWMLIAFGLAAALTLATIRPPNAHYMLIPTLPLALAAGVGLRSLARARGARAGVGSVVLGVAGGWLLVTAERGEISMMPVGVATVLAAVAMALVLARERDGRSKRAGAAVVIAFGAGAMLLAGSDLEQVLRHPGSAAAVRAVAPAIRAAVDPSQPIAYEGRQLQTAVFYAQRNVVGLDALLESGEPLPDRWVGIFTSPVYRGLAGWDATLLASAPDTFAVALRRAEGEAELSATPRLVVTPDLAERAFETYRLLGAAPLRVERDGYVNVIATARGGHDWLALPPAANGNARALQPTTADTWTLDLGATERVAGVRVLLGSRKPGHVPGLAIAASADGSELHELVSVGDVWIGFAWDGEAIRDSHQAFVEARFPATRARTIRIQLAQPVDGPAVTPLGVELSAR